MPSFRFRSCVRHLCYFDPRTTGVRRGMNIQLMLFRLYFDPRTRVECGERHLTQQSIIRFRSTHLYRCDLYGAFFFDSLFRFAHLIIGVNIVFLLHFDPRTCVKCDIIIMELIFIGSFQSAHLLRGAISPSYN